MAQNKYQVGDICLHPGLDPYYEPFLIEIIKTGDKDIFEIKFKALEKTEFGTKGFDIGSSIEKKVKILGKGKVVRILYGKPQTK